MALIILKITILHLKFGKNLLKAYLSKLLKSNGNKSMKRILSFPSETFSYIIFCYNHYTTVTITNQNNFVKVNFKISLINSVKSYKPDTKQNKDNDPQINLVFPLKWQKFIWKDLTMKQKLKIQNLFS